MRVGVRVIRAGREQCARFAQVGADRAIRRVELGVDDAHAPLIRAAQPRPVVAITPVVHHRKDGVDACRFAQVEVVLAVIGRHVDEACARGGVEPAEMVHRVAGLGTREQAATNPPWALQIFLRINPEGVIFVHCCVTQANAAQQVVQQFHGDDHSFVADANLSISIARICDRLVDRNCPRGCRPDDHVSADKFRRIRNLD